MAFDWDQYKENAQPIKSGYAPSAIAKLAAAPINRDDFEKKKAYVRCSNSHRIPHIAIKGV